MQVRRESFRGELVAQGRAMKRWCIRWHLNRYPVELLRHWMDSDRSMLGWPTADAAYADWRAGLPAPRRLFKSKPPRPQLRVVGGTECAKS